MEPVEPVVDYRSAEIERIVMQVGQVRTLESLRLAVVPPYLLTIPFIELPPGVELVRQDALEGEGVNGAIFTLRALEAGEGVLHVGFRDLREQRVVIEKSIPIVITARPPRRAATRATASASRRRRRRTVRKRPE